MTIRNTSLKKINKNAQSQEVDDSLTCVIEMYFKADTLLQLANDDVKLTELKVDKSFAFNNTQNNAHRLFKQMRSFQRKALAVYFHKRNDLTHYVYEKRKLKVEKFNETSVCNRFKIFHLYAIENHEDFEKIKERVAAL